MDTICRLVRAVTRPYPGAFSYIQNKKVTIWDAKPFSRDFFNEAVTGEVVFVASNKPDEFVVKCGDGCVLVTDIEPTVTVKTGERFA